MATEVDCFESGRKFGDLAHRVQTMFEQVRGSAKNPATYEIFGESASNAVRELEEFGRLYPHLLKDAEYKASMGMARACTSKENFLAYFKECL
ncbi:MAG: hypothetical protein V2A62_04670 [Candidatus Woesearchaeota archaeon]